MPHYRRDKVEQAAREIAATGRPITDNGILKVGNRAHHEEHPDGIDEDVIPRQESVPSPISNKK